MSRTSLLRMIAGALFAGLAAIASTAAAQETFPGKPIKIVVPFPPGGTADIIARIFTQHLPDRLGQQFIVDNKPGASTVIGARLVAKSEPDGYTLLLASPSSHGYGKDFKPIAMLAVTPYFLTMNASVPATNVGELVAYMKSGKASEVLRYGSSGVGGTPHLAGVQFNLLAGTNAVHVPYKGSADSILALVRSEIQLIFVGLPTTQEYVDSGKLRLLGAAGSQRSVFRPDLPTLEEHGLKGFDASAWFAIMAPVAIADARADKLAEAINAVAAMDEVKEALKKSGAETQIMTRASFATFIQNDYERWKRLMETAGLSTESKD